MPSLSSSSSSSLLPFSLLYTILFIFSIAFTFTDIVNCISSDVVINSPMLTSKIGTNRTVIVDIDGGEDFTSVQAAINSVPDGNSEWIIIHVRAGLYREKIRIPESKPYIFLRGNGKGKTKIVWNQSSTENDESATFTVKANNFIAWGISFMNEAPVGVAGAANNKSVAAYVAADKAAFYRCGFYSKHNTLFDAKGRHYYDNCYITGSIDFIFGRARSIFWSCEIFVVSDKRTTIQGSITAHIRKSDDEYSGFVFIKGKVYGIGSVYLGRARAAHSRVIFAKTYLSRTIVPDGWTNWSYDDSIDKLELGEYHTHGPGAGPAQRVSWSRQLTKEEVAPFMSIAFIDGREWLPVYQDGTVDDYQY